MGNPDNKRQWRSADPSGYQAAIKGKLSERNVSPEDVEGVGIGVPVRFWRTECQWLCESGMGVFNVAEELSGLLGGILSSQLMMPMSPLLVSSGRAVVKASECRHGDSGTGVGGGIIVGGRILRAATVRQERSATSRCGKTRPPSAARKKDA